MSLRRYTASDIVPVPIETPRSPEQARRTGTRKAEADRAPVPTPKTSTSAGGAADPRARAAQADAEAARFVAKVAARKVGR